MLKVAKRQKIGNTVKEAESIREIILNYVFEGVREGFFNLTTELKSFLEVEYLTEELKDIIRKKLIRFKAY